MENKPFLLNAFSIQMLGNLTEASVRFEMIDNLPNTDSLQSAVGHPDTAAVLGVEMNRCTVVLEKGDTAYVAQLVGGRLPEGATTLPEGFSFKYYRITVD